MNLEQRHTTASHHLPSQTNTRLQGGRLIFARVVWAVLNVLALVIFFAGVPLFYAQLQTVCESPLCTISQEQAQTLGQLGISVKSFALANLAFALLLALVRFAVGAVLVWHKSNDRMGLLASGMLILDGTSGVTTVVARASSSGWQFPSLLLNSLAFVAVSLVLFLFPDGRFVPRWTRWIVVLLVVVGGLNVLFPDTLLYTVLGFGGLACFVPAQLYRYRRVSNQVLRQQTRWVIYSVSVVVVFNFLLFSLLLLPAFRPPDSVYFLFAQPLVMLTSLLFPISLGIAILRYQLWDIDLIIHRTLVYGLLTVSIVGMYVFVVGYLGTLFHTNGNLLISLIAAGLVAVAFQPLRVLLQRGANRLLYGLRDEPYVVLARLGQRLQTTLDPDAILSTIVETVREALKLSYAAIEMKEGATFVLAASAGIPPAKEALRLPLIYHSESLGTLLIAPRGRDEALTPTDLHLVHDLADQIGIAVHAVRLTSDLKRMATDVQRSRERLVVAREEERRRLRRDLHDGLGPTLAALALTASNVCDLIPTDPDAAVALANALQNDIRATVKDIRRLVYELRPPTLDELGLVAAIRECVAQFSSSQQTGKEPGSSHRLQVQVEAPEILPALPAAVEVAIYRIVQEALTNVTRHAHAHTCLVRLVFTDAVEVEILDDGIGLLASYQAGVGLLSMRERAAELGGSCIIEKQREAGTRVCARLPVSKE